MEVAVHQLVAVGLLLHAVDLRHAPPRQLGARVAGTGRQRVGAPVVHGKHRLRLWLLPLVRALLVHAAATTRGEDTACCEFVFFFSHK